MVSNYTGHCLLIRLYRRYPILLSAFLSIAFLVGHPSRSAGDLTNGLVLHYSFDSDSDTNVWDDSGNGNNGYLVGAVTHVTGLFGSAIRITTPTTYVVSTSPSLNMNGWTGFTASVWVMMEGYTTYGQVISRGEVTGGTPGAFEMVVGGVYGGHYVAGGADVWTNTSGAFSVSSSHVFANNVTPYPPLNQWHYLTETCDGTNLSYYVDGVMETNLVVSAAGMPLWDSPVSKLMLGNASRTPCINWLDEYLNGLIDEVRIYNRALSSNEIAAEFERLRIPVINNNPGPSNITLTSALLGGTLTATGATPAKVSVFWGLSDEGTNASSWSNAVFLGTRSAGAFATNITGLASNTTYYYRCYASNSCGIAWAASTTNFTTMASSNSLAITSLYGIPGPAAGVWWLTQGAQINASVNSPVPNGSTTQYVCTGWTGSGSVTNGTGTNMTFSLNWNSTLTWLWKTQYLAIASAGAGGSVALTNAAWVDFGGSTASYTATPNPAYQVDQWYVNGVSTQTGGTNFTASGLTGPVTVLVTFLPLPVAATPTFSPASGLFHDSFNVTVQCATPGATIHYTTTGVDPTESDATVASGGTVLVANSLTLKAKAWASGYAASAVESAGYAILDPRVSILSPTNGAVFYTPSAVTVLVSAAGTHGISSVKVLAGTNWLGTVTNTPYQIVWSNAEAGDYVLTALAKDTQSHETTSLPVDMGVMSPLWEGAVDLGGGWRWSSWFGFFAESGNDWIFHLQHGWMYCAGINSESIWFWTLDMNWLWTGSAIYPYLYRNNDNAWLWYSEDPGAPRWFFNLKTSLWESR